MSSSGGGGAHFEKARAWNRMNNTHASNYSGAPFFAAMSVLRMGADLSHVICSPTASGSIKSYSPDLIVHPILREDKPTSDVREELKGLLQRLHALVIGPGLGREGYMQEYARLAIDLAKNQDMYLVLDADALWMVQKDPSIIHGYTKAVLTPNISEFKRLANSLGIPSDVPSESIAPLMSRRLNGVTILQKGQHDLITVHVPEKQAEETFIVDIEGGLKRCGGQGDILSGITGTMLAWGKNYELGVYGEVKLPPTYIPLLASIGACLVTRTTSRRGFKCLGRALVTEDLLSEIGHAFCDVFEGQDDQLANL
ncbi:hypothetical protein Clacol_005789 [Clathrus columnatus]|uniref:ATP-dependent (S)-NAD(P)H-hydrate dehydratase n=1 Tax=Clathrus columnatus TaxID=1419009 RepID=A0AAV5AF75_9AGAM|nr:hypothetical protein Clacol_005789 [Clathrus columnatus]